MRKIINYTLGLLMLTMVFSACEVDRTEEVFSDSPAVRIGNKINELRTLLLAQTQGFSGIYFPNDNQVGGVNFHMKFTEDLRVKISSDYKSTTGLTDTRYDIVAGTTAAELVFTTGSRHITDLIQDGAGGFDTFFGGNSFQYIGEDNGKITFKDVRSDGKLVISASGFTDFDTESVASSNKTYSNRLAFADVDCSTASAFDNLVMEIEHGGEPIRYILNYNSDMIFFDGETTNAEGVSSRQGFGAAFTLIGGQEAITISPALEVGENSFEHFMLDSNASETQYIATVNGVTATISSIRLPHPSGDELNDDKDLLDNAFLYRLSLGDNSLTSPCFEELVIDQINSNLDAMFGPGVFAFSQFQFAFNFDSDECPSNFLFIQIVDADGFSLSSFYCFGRSSISGNRLFQEYTGTFGFFAGIFENAFAPLIDFFNNPESTSSGMLYTNEGGFKTDINSFTNLSGTLTKMDNQALRVYGLFFN